MLWEYDIYGKLLLLVQNSLISNIHLKKATGLGIDVLRAQRLICFISISMSARLA
jgi:hypothetical protein